MTKRDEREAKRADQTSWRQKLKACKVKFDDAQKGVFLKHYEAYFRKKDAARAAGVCYQTVNNHIENDPDFADACEEARAAYADRVEKQMVRLAIEGVDKPIVGGENRDIVVATEKIFATNLLAMMAKRSNPEYKEKSDINLTGNGGGVLVMPAGLTPEQFRQQLEEHNALHEKEPGSDE